jgi:hypothetical protein
MTFFALRAFCSLWARIAVGVGWSILPKNGVGSIRKRRSGIVLGRPLRCILPTFLVQCSSSSGGSRAIGFMRQSRLVTEVGMHSWHNARLAMLLLANASSTWIASMSIAKRKLSFEVCRTPYQRGDQTVCMLPEARYADRREIDGMGRHVRQIQLCARHCETVIQRERKRGLEICDRRNEQRAALDFAIGKCFDRKTIRRN